MSLITCIRPPTKPGAEVGRIVARKIEYDCIASGDFSLSYSFVIRYSVLVREIHLAAKFLSAFFLRHIPITPSTVT
jgi:hypothetical protein